MSVNMAVAVSGSGCVAVFTMPTVWFEPLETLVASAYEDLLLVNSDSIYLRIPPGQRRVDLVDATERTILDQIARRLGERLDRITCGKYCLQVTAKSPLSAADLSGIAELCGGNVKYTIAASGTPSAAALDCFRHSASLRDSQLQALLDKLKSC